jgi:hypothetical protein
MATPHHDDADDPTFSGLGQPLLHERTYEVRSYLERPGAMRLRGRVHDRKPAGLYVPGDERPLEVHRMVIDLVVELPDLVISDARAVLETHPHAECPRIEDHYADLVGLSIARGFTHKARELFGGPRGCTHVTALLQAMAPVAIQSVWSMRAVSGGSEPVAAPRAMTPEDRRRALRFNLDTCHVWASDGPFVAELEAGGEIPIPLWAEARLRELGRDADEWRSMMRGE